MWLDEKKYNYTLDFESLKDTLLSLEDDESIVNDFNGIGEDSFTFFKDLYSAQSTEDMEKYSDEDIISQIDKLLGCKNLIDAICIYAEDFTILGDVSSLSDAMRKRRLSAVRRVL